MTEHVDLLIVGAGISGIGAAHYVREAHPERSLAILEARDDIGGTWDLFRYPGVRSDSDLFTFGYEFAPWTGDAIATGSAIMAYLRAVVAEENLMPLIRFGHKAVAGAWSSESGRWTVDVRHTHTGEHSTITANWVIAAGGYYRYDAGYTPDFPGRDRFTGTIVHPQFWPDDLDYRGKRIVVIGSGATAVTLVPALAADAAHVTMLQRTPTYVLPVPTVDRVAGVLQRVLGPQRGFRLVRAKNVLRQRLLWSLSQRHPKAVRRLIRASNVAALPAGYPVDEHFNPPYDPWDQRLCVVPDGDLFDAIAAGTVEVVTDGVATFTETGVQTTSGRVVPADIVVTATGLAVQPFGGATLTVDGDPVRLADTIAYKGMMLSGVPNLTYITGYTNSSWTLKVQPLCGHLNALLSYLDAHGYDIAVPVPSDPGMPTRPYLDFGAGYIQRVRDHLPRQGDRWPWLTSMDYLRDRRLLQARRVVDPELHFSRSEDRAAQRSSMTQV